MSKILPAAIMAIGGASGSVGIAYLAGAFGGVDYELPETFEKFKNENGRGCIKDVFSSIKGEKIEGLNLSSPSASSEITLDSTSGTEENGCLVVNWDKGKLSETDNTKGRGNFRFLWAFSKGNKGFMVYTSVKTSNADPMEDKFSLEGAAYFLNKPTDKPGEISKKLDAKTSNKLEKGSGNDDKLPKQGASFNKTGTGEGFESNSFWNFMKEDLDVSKLCKDCSVKGNFFRGYWSWEKATSGGGNLGSGSNGLNTGGDAIYDKTKGDMNTLVGGVNGKGVERKLSEIPPIT